MENATKESKEKSTINIKEKVLDIFSKYSMVIILIALLIAFQMMTGGIFLRPLNITNEHCPAKQSYSSFSRRYAAGCIVRIC